MAASALRPFLHHRPAALGAVWIACLVIVAIGGSSLRPDATPFANLQHLEWALLAPGASMEQANGTVQHFVLGTDRYGRDYLSRLMAGSAISLSVGGIAVLISLLIGVFLGAWAGYRGGKVDAVISWLIQVVWTLPTLLMVLAITLAFGKGFWQVFVAIGLTMWVDVARVVRGQFISLREQEFVEAAQSLGFSDFRIMFRHMLPNAAGPIIVVAAANFAAAILIESGLSFLGYGAQIPMPSWGNLVQEHYHLITGRHAWLALLPGGLIVSVVLAFTFVGDGIREWHRAEN
ncbi:MAG: ABC transporter permease [Bacteroidetes bacterium]|jgi:ABC-type dipeptide/oligopeptide/nickel transport system permease subunit|nr:ABC transporter permease [Bacteroidota bacterium]